VDDITSPLGCASIILIEQWMNRFHDSGLYDLNGTVSYAESLSGTTIQGRQDAPQSTCSIKPNPPLDSTAMDGVTCFIIMIF